MKQIRARLADGGRLVIPVEFRRALGLGIGDEVVLRLEDGEVRMFTVDHAIKPAQQMVRRYIPEGPSLADELIRQRRAEAERE